MTEDMLIRAAYSYGPANKGARVSIRKTSPVCQADAQEVPAHLQAAINWVCDAWSQRAG